MKLLFLIAATYLIIEYLNYLKRKESKEEGEKTIIEKAVDKATETIDKVVEETKEALSTPAKKSVFDVQSLDTGLPSAPVEETVVEEPVCEIPSEPVRESTIEEIQQSIDDSVVASKEELKAEESPVAEQLEIKEPVTPVDPSVAFQTNTESVEDEVTDQSDEEVEEEETY